MGPSGVAQVMATLQKVAKPDQFVFNDISIGKQEFFDKLFEIKTLNLKRKSEKVSPVNSSAEKGNIIKFQPSFLYHQTMMMN